MFLGVVGFLMVVIIVAALIRGKSNPVPLFVIVPVVAALITGFTPAQIFKFMSAGVGKTWSTAVLFIFSIVYFSMMGDMGLFDPMVNWLVKKAGSNIVMVTIATACIAVISHLDGALASTLLITIPAMLPIYKKLHMRPVVLVCIIGAAMSIMNLLPWGGPVARTGVVLNADVNALWQELIPLQGVGLVILMIFAAYMGVCEKRRGAGLNPTGKAAMLSEDEDEGSKDDNLSADDAAFMKRPKMIWFNGLLTIGKGQRVGLMAGSGVGKSVLLGMITRQTKADIVVVGLIGERGREVKEFIDHSLGADGLAKSIVVVAPADESPLMRLKATELCHSIAAWFRDRGHHVLLLVDSLTRYAMAQREIALSLGEPPATKGYPPSAFGMIPKLVESAGNSESAGSMTAIYTVLAEGDDQQDPIVDCARAVLDGHIVLTRKLAEAGHYPAIDIGQSISRCMNQVTSLEHQQSARALKQNYAAYMEIKPLIPLGGYVAGADASVDKAVKMFPAIERFLRQEMREPASLELVQSRLQILFPGVKKAEQ